MRTEAGRIARERKITAHETQSTTTSPCAQIKVGNLCIAGVVPVRGQLTRLAGKIRAKRRRQSHGQRQCVQVAVCAGRQDPRWLARISQGGAHTAVYDERICSSELGPTRNFEVAHGERTVKESDRAAPQVPGPVNLCAFQALAVGYDESERVSM